MKISDFYSNSNVDSSNVRNSLKISGQAASLNCVPGDIIEGTVTAMGQDVKVSFSGRDTELNFPKDSLKNTYVGDTRRFQVMGTENDKLILKDLGSIAGDVQTRAAMRTTVDSQLATMAEDFAETNGAKEEEDESNIERLTDEDYSELRREGFSIEDFKAERLSRAIDRIKLNRAAKKNSIDAQSEELARQKKEVSERAAKAVSDKYAASRDIIERLVESDVPVTDSNIASIIGAIGMSAQTAMLTDNSFAYMIKNELTPSVKNIYTSVFSGVVKRGSIDDGSWEQLKTSVQGIVNEANEILGEEALVKMNAAPENNVFENNAGENKQQEAVQLENATGEDARWLVEYDIPVNKENLVYKKELEELKANGRSERDVADAAARALARGEKAEDAILIESREYNRETPSGTIEDLTSRLRLQEIRLSMTVESRNSLRIDGLAIDIEALSREVEELKEQVISYYNSLADEIGAPRSAVETAVNTASTIEDIASAPLSIYALTYSRRTTITLEEIGSTATQLRAQELTSGNRTTITVKALGSYEASATEIRADLGDSIRKAFNNTDSLIADTGLEVTEANRRAVRILGYNSMEITAQSITEMKYYDAKLTTMVEGMKPSIVMSMIKRGFNPLEQDIDSINAEIADIMEQEGYSSEEKFSSFLVKMEAEGNIDEQTRNAYIGIYRLLYQIEKTDGAVIGAALNSGRKLTLSNLLTEARTARRGVDASIDDDTQIRNSVYTNSVSDQIIGAFSEIGRNGGFAENTEYHIHLAEQAMDVTEPAAWQEALENENYGELTLEQVTESLLNADKHYDGSTQPAAAIRNIFAVMTPGRRFLKNLGLDDSKTNSDAFDSDPAIEIASKDELIEAMDGPEQMQDIFDRAKAQVQNDAELELLGAIPIISRGIRIDEQLARYDLLGQMAGHEHYRLNVDNNGSPARINLTVIHSPGNAGTVSLEVNTTDYSIKADLSLTVFTSEGTAGNTGAGRIDGRISADSIPQLNAIEAPLAGFLAAMTDEGFDVSGISAGADRIPEERYLNRIGENKHRTEAATTAVERNRRDRNVSTQRLYAMAKSFLSFML
ncbi:MAG: hypothetical protein IK071_03425 [Lachnospiraceae bacterium]|nr:hypothetical protein [Lachnospiraceae bacterium]